MDDNYYPEVENTTSDDLDDAADVNRTSIPPVYSIGTKFIEKWKLKKQQERVCRYVFNKVLTPECTQYNASSDWDVDDPSSWASGSGYGPADYDFMPDWLALNSSSNFSLSLNATTAFTTTEEEYLKPVLPPFELWQAILIALALGICIILTVGGNILVLLAFIVDRTIRQPSNYFIASLAATDMLIGTVSMPFFTVYVLMGYWDLGPLLCDLWLSVDYTVCLVSQYTVLLITIDRFCSVKIAAKYRSWRTKNRVIWMVTITWIIPALLFFISIFGWEHFVGFRDLAPGQCAVQFLKDPVFNTALIIGYYWTTLIVLFILYGGIYKTAYDMQKKSEAKQRKMQSMVALSAGAWSGMAGRAAGIGISQAQSTLVVEPKQQLSASAVVTTIVTPTTTTTTGSQEDTAKEHDNKNKAENKSRLAEPQGPEAEKSERSSSPAFDSDEDSAPATKGLTAAQLSTLRKRSSIAGLVAGSGALQVFATNAQRMNGMLPIKVEMNLPILAAAAAHVHATEQQRKMSKASPLTSPGDGTTNELAGPQSQKTPTTPALPKIHETMNGAGLLEADNIQYEKSSPGGSSLTLTPERPRSADMDKVAQGGGQQPPLGKDSTPTTSSSHIIPPPSEFRGSLSSQNNTSSTTSSLSTDRGQRAVLIGADGSCTTYDIMTGLDGADLRFMDESSVIVPSPSYESPPSSFSCSLANPLSTAPSSPILGAAGAQGTPANLLQAALIRAHAQQQVNTGEKRTVTTANASSQTLPPRVFITHQSNVASQTSPIVVSKLNTEVSVKPEDPSGKQPTTSIITPAPDLFSSSVTIVQETSISCASDNLQPSPRTPNSFSLLPATSSSSGALASTSANTVIGPNTPAPKQEDSKKQSSKRDPESSGGGGGGGSRRDLVKAIGKRLKAKTQKNDPTLGRQKSRTENRARKAFRTISFILGAFVACWTPYHILALVEGFCSEPPCTNEHLFMFSYFLCYANSPMNPFCYALANQQFKKTFTRILRGDLHMT